MILKRHNIISVIYQYGIGENGMQNVLLITSTSACPTPLEICFAILNAYPTFFSRYSSILLLEVGITV